MARKTSSPADRMAVLLDHLGLDRAHVLACMSGDWSDLVTHHAHRVCSLTVVAPHLNKGIPDDLRTFGPPCLVVGGDRGAPARRARDLAGRFARGELYELEDYESPAWADTIADRADAVAGAVGDFLARAEREGGVPGTVAAQGEGEVAGVRYRIDGRGPALVCLPLSFAPSQWDPLVPRLCDRYSIVRLGGPHLGVIALLEGRAHSGYGDLAARLLDRTGLAPGETVLEVGCGSGALVRALAGRTGRGVSIVASDVNPYLLSEARSLAESAGVQDAIAFERADAEALPYPDGRFDVAYCCTVMEEGDADRMVAELARVTRPGGRVAVMTRALDVPWWVNLDLPDEPKRRIEALGSATGAGVGDRGCADARLYARLTAAGLTPLAMGPQFAAYGEGDRLDDVLDRLVAGLGEDDVPPCRDAIDRARAKGVLFVCEPFHCAVARK